MEGPSPVGKQSTSDDVEQALKLVSVVRDMLIAGANSMGGGDAARYHQAYLDLDRVLSRLGIGVPFPWPSIREGIEASKTEHSGAGSYHLRREYFKNMAAPTLAMLRQRAADRQAGDIQASLDSTLAASSATLSNIAAIRAELVRIERSLPQDPTVAIGKAKNLVEATAKVILGELGEPVAPNAKVRDVATAVARSLGLSTTGPPADREAAKIVSRVLGLVDDISTLRNQAGDGHGVAILPVGLDTRHGRLAVRAAITWCGFILDTYADQHPPGATP